MKILNAISSGEWFLSGELPVLSRKLGVFVGKGGKGKSLHGAWNSDISGQSISRSVQHNPMSQGTNKP